jgi:hypothetical protein
MAESLDTAEKHWVSQTVRQDGVNPDLKEPEDSGSITW